MAIVFVELGNGTPLVKPEIRTIANIKSDDFMVVRLPNIVTDLRRVKLGASQALQSATSVNN